MVDDALYVHFLTFSVYRRRRLLDHDHPKRIVLGVLNNVMSEFRAKCVGFVLTPEHIHALVWLSETGELSNFVKEWKRQSSLAIRRWMAAELSSYTIRIGETDRFWQPKYYAFEIYEEAKLEAKLNYMHLNPVRRGFVQRAVDWKWSSARWYERRQTVGVPIEWVR
jgi:putative transposase